MNSGTAPRLAINRDFPLWCTATLILALTVIGAIMVAECFRFPYPASHDDAYIAFQYARRFVEGSGLVFNVGERVWGFTSPLQVIFLCVIGLLGFPIPEGAIVMGIVAACAAAAAVYALMRAVLPPTAALILALLFATCRPSFRYLGMETQLLILLEVVFLLLAERGRPVWAGFAGALACLTRPDAILLVVPVIALSPRLRTRAALAAFGLPGILWISFALWYFGSWLPQSLHAKASFPAEWFAYIPNALRRFVGAPEVVQRVVRAAGLDLISGWISGLVVATLLSGCCVLDAKFRARPWLLFALIGYPWVQLVVYARLGPPVGQEWHYMAAAALYSLGAFAGLAALLRKCPQARTLPPLLRLGAGLAIIAAAVVMISENLSMQRRRLTFNDRYFWHGARHRTYLEVAAWLNGHARRTDRLLITEPGTVAFHTDLYVGDESIISPQMKRPPELLLKSPADASIYFRRSRYVLAARFSGTGYHPFAIYKRVDKEKS